MLRLPWTKCLPDYIYYICKILICGITFTSFINVWTIVWLTVIICDKRKVDSRFGFAGLNYPRMYMTAFVKLIPAFSSQELSIQGCIWPPLIVHSRSWFAGINYQRWSYTPFDSSFRQFRIWNYLPVYLICIWLLISIIINLIINFIYDAHLKYLLVVIYVVPR